MASSSKQHVLFASDSVVVFRALEKASLFHASFSVGPRGNTSVSCWPFLFPLWMLISFVTFCCNARKDFWQYFTFKAKIGLE